MEKKKKKMYQKSKIVGSLELNLLGHMRFSF